MLKDINSHYEFMMKGKDLIHRKQWKLQAREDGMYQALYRAHLHIDFNDTQNNEDLFDMYHRYLDYYLDMNVPRLFKRKVK